MSELIDVVDFIDKNYKGFDCDKKLTPGLCLHEPGIVVRDKKIFIEPYMPNVETFYHNGLLIDFTFDYKDGFHKCFDNLENIKKGYFGNTDSYTYMATDNGVKPSKPNFDLTLIIDAKKIGLVYRDPESFMEQYRNEWDRAFMIKGAIPKDAIVDVSFSSNMRLINGLRIEKGVLLDLNMYFNKIEKIKKEFKALF